MGDGGVAEEEKEKLKALQSLRERRDEVSRQKGPGQRSTADEQVLSAVLMEAVSPPRDYPEKLLEGLEKLSPSVKLSDSEAATLLHALSVWAKIDSNLRIGLENDVMFFRALCQLIDAGGDVKGIDRPKLLRALAKCIETSGNFEACTIAMLVARDIIYHTPRQESEVIIHELCRACIRVIDREQRSIVVQIAIELISALPIRRAFAKFSDRLARALCKAVTIDATGANANNAGHSRAAKRLCTELLSKPCRHRFFASLTQVATSPVAGSHNVELVQGAVYFISMSLWGRERIPVLAREVPLSSALATLRVAASSREDAVITEISLSLKRLVKKYGPELDVEWDALLGLLDELFPYASQYEQLYETALELAALYLRTPVDVLQKFDQELFETRQQLLESNMTYEQIGNVLDRCKNFLSEPVALRLMQARAASAEPWRGLDTYVDVLQKVMLLYYRNEPREAIRVEALQTLRDALWTYQGLYDDTLVGEVLLPYVGGEGDSSSRSAHEELKLLFEVARDLPISDKRFSAILTQFEERANQNLESAGEVTKLVAELLHERMTRTPISRTVTVFKSLVGVHMHSPSYQSRKEAICMVASISATSQFRIVCAGVHSYFLVSHLSSARRGRESSTIVQFPIQYAFNNFVQLLQEELYEDLSLEIFCSMEALLANVFVVRDCKLDWLARSLLNHVKDGLEYTKVPRLRHKLLVILNMLAGYGHEIDHTIKLLTKELRSADSETTELLNMLFGLLCLCPVEKTVVQMLETIEGCLDQNELETRENLPVLECLRSLASIPVQAEVAAKGIQVVMSAVRLAEKASSADAPRWRRICLAAYILWARKALPVVVNKCASLLGALAKEGDILSAACVEYAGCFVYEDERSNVDNTRKEPHRSENSEDVSTSTFVVGEGPFRHLVTVKTSGKTPAEVLQRRPTGTSRFWVQSSHLSSALRYSSASGRKGEHEDTTRLLQKPSNISTSIRQQERDHAGLGNEVSRASEVASESELSNLLGLVDVSEGSRRSKLKKRDAIRRARESGKTMKEAINSAWETMQSASPALSTRDPAHLLCQLGCGGLGACPLPTDDELLPFALKVLDKLPAEDTHRIGLIYVGEADGDEASILDNIAGSDAYLGFLRRLGSFIRLGKTNGNIFTGGLDVSGRDIDGEYCLHWADSATQVVFHVTTLMPNSERSGGGVLKKRHVGNDHVNVIWSEKGPDFDPKMVDSQFNSVHIVVSPGGSTHYRVRVRVNKKGIKPFGPLCPDIVQVVSEEALGSLVRATAINADVVCTDVIANWEERASQIAKIGQRAQGDSVESPRILV